MAGLTRYWQVPFNSSSHLFYLHDLCESQTYMASRADWGLGGGDWFLHLVSYLDFLSWKKISCKKIVLQGTIIVRSKEANFSHICVNKDM